MNDPVPSVRRSLLELSGIVLLLAAWGAGLLHFAGLPDLARLPAWPGFGSLVVLMRNRSTPLDGAVQVTVLAQWLVWGALVAWLALSLAIELVLAAAEARAARSAAWLRGLRVVAQRASFPLVRHAVATALAVQVVVRPPVSAFAEPLTIAQQEVQPSAYSQGEEPAAADAVWHTVQPGDTLWNISQRYYGTGEEWERLIDANVDRPMLGGGTFTRAGMIYPGWLLRVPLPARSIDSEDGQTVYTVRSGDTLRGIAARLLGSEDRVGELVALNVGQSRLGPDGPVLENPDLIWPGLQLRLPSDEPSEDVAVDESNPAPPDPAPASAAPAPVAPVSAPDLPDPAIPREVPAPPPVPTVISQPDVPPTPVPVASPAVASAEPVPPSATEPAHVAPEQAAVAGAGAAAAFLAGGALVVRRRRPAPVLTGQESDVQVEDGFANADPVEGLVRRLARTSDPPSAVASLLAQAYAAHFAEHLSEDEQHEAMQGVALAATRHGRTSTTLILAAPMAARPHLVRGMQAATARAFGEYVDVDGLVSNEGDVLVRLTWDPRHPVPGNVLDLVGAGASDAAWPAPCLVQMLVLYDRQPFAVNWHALSNVLVAMPTGQGVETPLTGLVTSLASVRRPEDLGVVLLARPHTLPGELGRLPHLLMDPADPGEAAVSLSAVEGVRQELERRMTDGATDEPDLVVVVRELGDVEPAAMRVLGTIAAAGPRYGVRLVAASERPVAEVLQTCPFLDAFGTRLVLETRDEEESVALLGTPGAEDLGSGGHAMLRLEGRQPTEGWACRVPADHLARMLNLMGTRTPRTTAADDDSAATEEGGDQPVEQDAAGPGDGPEVVDVGEPATASAELPAEATTASAWPGSPLLQRLRSAPIRVRCLGARDVWYGDRLLPLSDPEVLLLLAVHPITGIQSEALADMLWEDGPSNPNGALRKRRFRVRDDLRRMVPEVTADPLPGDPSHGERVVALNVDVIASDVHEFLELLKCARSLEPADAVQAYEAALALYRGDLLDSVDMPNYRWMYDGAQVALTLRSDYRRQQREARLRLAELLAAGHETGLVRAAELYVGLCAEEPDDERLWTALFPINERAGSLLGLESAVRRLRAALTELAPNEVDVESVPLPPKLDRLVQQIRERIGAAHTQIGATSQSLGS